MGEDGKYYFVIRKCYWNCHREIFNVESAVQELKHTQQEKRQHGANFTPGDRQVKFKDCLRH